MPEDEESDRQQGAPGGPVFVVGSMRSGSTLLRLILDSHPSIAIGPETGFMGALHATRAIPNWKYGEGWYRLLDWTDDEFDARLREFYGGLFRRYASAQGKPRWGEKTPFHTGHIPEMARVFPDAVFVGIVRHPGAVAASLRKGFHYSYLDALAYWASTNLDMVRAGTQLGERFVVLRYEDLVAEGESVLRELVDWLSEPWSSLMLRHHRVQQAKGAPRSVDGRTSTRDPIDSERAHRWSRTATDEDRVALHGTASLAAFFGYEPADSVVREQLGHETGARRRWLLDGHELRARREAWAGRLDFEERPATIPIDASIEDLANRLSRAEQALARTRSRRLVRWGDALRKVQHGRSLRDARDAWALIRTPRG